MNQIHQKLLNISTRINKRFVDCFSMFYAPFIISVETQGSDKSSDVS